MNRTRIVALWAQNPKLTIEQVRRLTGAPSATVRRVHRDLVAAGRVQPRRIQPDALRAV